MGDDEHIPLTVAFALVLVVLPAVHVSSARRGRQKGKEEGTNEHRPRIFSIIASQRSETSCADSPPGQPSVHCWPGSEISSKMEGKAAQSTHNVPFVASELLLDVGRGFALVIAVGPLPNA